jgi:hypothetical protein
MGDQKQQKDKSVLLALLFIGAALLLLYFAFGTAGKKPTAQEITKNKTFEKAVNKHLLSTSEKIEFDRQKAVIENSQYANDFRSGKSGRPAYQPDNNLDLSTDSRSSTIVDDIGRGKKAPSDFQTPDEIVQSDIFNDQQSAEYSQAYKEAYAKQFVENARKGGYNVILTDDFKVKSVQPIRKPTQSMDIFEGGNDGRSQQ